MFTVYKYNYIQCRYARAELFYDNFIKFYETFELLQNCQPKTEAKVRVISLYQKQKLLCSTLSMLTTKRAFFACIRKVVHCEEPRTRETQL